MKQLKAIKISFKSYITSIALLVLLTVLAVFMIKTIAMFKQNSTEMIDGVNRVRFDTVISSIQNEVDGVVKTCSYLMENKRFEFCMAQISKKDITLYNKVLAHQELNSMMNLAVNQNKLISDIGVKSKNKFYGYGPTLSLSNGEKIVSNLLVSADNLLVINKNTLTEKPYYYFSFSLLDGNNDRCDVFVLLNIEYEGFSTITDKNLAVFDNDKASVPIGAFSGTEVKSYKEFADAAFGAKNELESMTYLEELAGIGWTVAYKAPQDKLKTATERMLSICAVLFAVSLLLFFLLAHGMSKRVAKPVGLFTNLLKSYKSNDVNSEHVEFSLQKAFTIRENIFAFLMITVLIPAAFFLVSHSFMTNLILENLANNSYEAALENKAQDLSAFFQAKEKALARIVYSDTVSNAIEELSRSPEADTSSIYSVVEENVYFSIDDGAVSLYNINGLQVFSNSMFLKKQQSIDDLQTQLGWKVQENLLNQTSVVLTQKSIGLDNFRTIGYAQLSYKFSDVFRQLENQSLLKGNVYVIDSEGKDILTGDIVLSTMFSKSNDSMLASVQDENRWHIVPIERTPWFLVTEPENTRNSLLNMPLGENKQMLVLMLISVVAGTYALSYMIIRPINKTNHMLLLYEPGNPDITLDENSFIDEIGEINKSFNDMTLRIDELIDDIVISHTHNEKLESEKKTAEITALQMQINPHFLSNTIETISGIIQDGEAQKAIEMLFALNNLFRYGISKYDYMIPISEEVRNSQAYTDIMKVRHSKIKFVWEVDAQIINCVTIKLLLQPLIENAIYHGLYKSGKEGEIKIRVGKEVGKNNCTDKMICFSVKDNGEGMDEKTLLKLYSSLDDTSEESRIGLYNVQSRLRLHYGSSCSLEICSKPQVGTEIKVKIPQRFSKYEKVKTFDSTK